eukprot:SAG22_NODE_4928_length_1129_cov_1.600971_1_plen_86_part_10
MRLRAAACVQALLWLQLCPPCIDARRRQRVERAPRQRMRAPKHLASDSPPPSAEAAAEYDAGLEAEQRYDYDEAEAAYAMLAQQQN